MKKIVIFAILLLAQCQTAKQPCNCSYLNTTLDLQQRTIFEKDVQIDSLRRELGTKKMPFGKE
jgi:hypothetical protein